jgi:hypothetical protein
MLAASIACSTEPNLPAGAPMSHRNVAITVQEAARLIVHNGSPSSNQMGSFETK